MDFIGQDLLKRAKSTDHALRLFKDNRDWTNDKFEEHEKWKQLQQLTGGVRHEYSWFSTCSDRITKESVLMFDGPMLRAKLSEDWEEKTCADLI